MEMQTSPRQPCRRFRRRRSAAQAIVAVSFLGGVVWCGPGTRPVSGSSSAGGAGAAPLEPATAVTVQDRLAELPLAFEPNRGQTAAAVDFVARGAGYNLFLTPTEAVLGWPQAAAGSGRAPAGRRLRSLRMELVGADAGAVGVGLDPMASESHYFLGSDPAAWRTRVPSFARVRYQDVYPGIDLFYFGKQRALEYELVVAPGADPQAVRLAFHGADRLRLDKSGNLRVTVGVHEVIQRAPFIYQEIDGAVRQVAGRYRVAGSRQVSFELAAFDVTRPLVIDPPVSLVYGTYLGGSLSDLGLAITVDGAGNSYVTGSTLSLDFPTVHPFQNARAGGTDAFIAKLDATGTAFVYATYVGGSTDSNGSGIAVDGAGNAYVTGNTSSADFPLQNPLQAIFGGVQDAFLIKLGPTGGALVFATYVGGSNMDLGLDVTVDAAADVYLTGRTRSADFPSDPLAFQPALAGGADAFVVKVDTGGSSLLYSTYLGGSGDDLVLGIAVDGFGSAYVTGRTLSADFPTSGPVQAARSGTSDAFVAKLDPLGAALEYATFLGGAGDECGNAIAVDGAGSAYVTGETDSTDFPTAGAFQKRNRGGQGDAFAVKLNAVGDSLVYSTYLGGRDRDAGNAIAVDGAGSAVVAGETRSANFPRAGGGPLVAPGGAFDAFVTRLDPQGSFLVYSIRVGGGSNDGADGVAVDATGDVYVAGTTQSNDFPTTPGAPQTARAGGNDVFLVKLTSR